MRMCIENNILSDLLAEIMHMCMENDNYAIRFIGGNNAYVYGKWYAIRFIGGNNAYVYGKWYAIRFIGVCAIKYDTYAIYYEQLYCLLSTYAVLHVWNIAFVYLIMYSSLHIGYSIGMYNLVH